MNSDPGALRCTKVPLWVFDIDITTEHKQKQCSRRERLEELRRKRMEWRVKFAEYDEHWQEIVQFFRQRGVNII